MTNFIFVIFKFVTCNMTLKQYKNRLGVYEPYQSGGGGEDDGYKSGNSEHKHNK